MSDQQRIIDSVRAACQRSGLEAESLVGYLMFGHGPGHFIGSVLEDSLSQAARYGDSYNRKRLLEWAEVMYNTVPLDAYGSKDRVKAWMKAGGFVGRNIATLEARK